MLLLNSFGKLSLESKTKLNGKTKMIVKTSSKGQIVIPKKIRRELNIKKGQALEISLSGDHLEIRPLPADPISHLKGILKGGPSLTKELLRERKSDDEKHEHRRS